jgi:hypothetical protein
MYDLPFLCYHMDFNLWVSKQSTKLNSFHLVIVQDICLKIWARIHIHITQMAYLMLPPCQQLVYLILQHFRRLSYQNQLAWTHQLVFWQTYLYHFRIRKCLLDECNLMVFWMLPFQGWNSLLLLYHWILGNVHLFQQIHRIKLPSND